MTYNDAINGLTVGKAAKLPTWGGYIKKTLASGANAPAWSNTSAYSVGQFVTQGSQVYICRTAIDAPASGSTNTWDATKWIATELDFNITFQELQDPASGIGHDSATTYTFVHAQSVTSGATAVTWTVTAPTNPTLEIDAQLYKALLSTDWMIGNTADFEVARTGSGRW